MKKREGYIYRERERGRRGSEREREMKKERGTLGWRFCR